MGEARGVCSMGETSLIHKEPPPTFSLPTGLPVLRVRVTLHRSRMDAPGSARVVWSAVQ
jgi:hypothetical protein